MRTLPHDLARVIILAGSLTGCQPVAGRPQEMATGSAEPAVVTVEANDYAFGVPARVPAGVVTFRLVNQGKEAHHAQVIRLEDGKTVADFVRAFTDTASMPAWVRYLGGPVGTAPGQELHSTTRLAPGRHALICRIRSPDGTTHVMKGMIREFEVLAGQDGGSAPLPVASDTMTLNDYGFVTTRPLTPGPHTIRVTNAGPQVHEVIMLKLAPGKTPADFARWGLSGRHGPAPGAPVGGVEFIDQGEVGVFAVELAPGEYGYICFVPDAKDGKRHFRHGMMTQFAVQ